MDELENRRMFLRAAAAAGVAWLASDLLAVEEALAWAAHQASNTDAATTVLTRAEADVIDRMTARILPPVDGRPGAHDAGVVHFIDRALSTFNAGERRLYRNGIADLNRRARRLRRGASGFAGLAAADQDEILRAIEKTPFFQRVRFGTIVGMFALPTWGGNRDHTGWQMLGLAHQPVFQAPFGSYDADVNRDS